MKIPGTRASLLLALIAVASLAGCSGQNDEVPGVAADGTSAAIAGTEPVRSTPAEGTGDATGKDEAKEGIMQLKVGRTELTATLAKNSSADALRDLLADGPVTIAMQDYEGMEKVGALGTTLPRNDERITAEPGDLILYQGSQLVIYYAPNTWSFTRIGKIDDVTAEELRTVLGSGSVTVTLSL